MAELPQRKIIRYKDFDYSSPGVYHVTFCTDKRMHVFGNADSGKMLLNENGQIAEEEIHNIPIFFPNIEVAHHIVMPDHIHMLIGIKDYFFTSKEEPLIHHPVIGSVVGKCKACITKRLGVSVWQPKFHDTIIRSEEHFYYTISYINNNPKKWAERRAAGKEPDM